MRPLPGIVYRWPGRGFALLVSHCIGTATAFAVAGLMRVVVVPALITFSLSSILGFAPGGMASTAPPFALDSKHPPRQSTLFSDACAAGNLALAKALTARRVDLNAQTEYNETPLLRAAVNGHADIVRHLLDAGAETETADRFGRTAYMSVPRCARTVPESPLRHGSTAADPANRRLCQGQGQPCGQRLTFLCDPLPGPPFSAPLLSFPPSLHAPLFGSLPVVLCHRVQESCQLRPHGGDGDVGLPWG